MTTEYDPDKHCCPEWDRDFCQCVKRFFRERKKDIRDENVNGTIKFLIKNNIEFTESKTPNVVIVNPNSDKIFLSLKRIQFGNVLKCRYNGYYKWYEFSKRKFLEKFKNN